MNSLIFRTVARFLVGLMLLFSIFLLLRGHNEPGGGFIGGLVAAAGIVVYGLAEGPAAVRKILRADPRAFAMAGLLIALIAGLISTLAGAPFLTGLWTFIGATPGDKGLALGTPLIFDIGVYQELGTVNVDHMNLAERPTGRGDDKKAHVIDMKDAA